MPTINSESDIASFIETQENPRAATKYFPYMDNGVPAIGYGSDLRDKSTHNVNMAYETIIRNISEQ